MILKQKLFFNSFLNISASGNYYVVATDSNHCQTKSNTIDINVNQIPDVSYSKNGDTLVAFNATSYQWFLNDSLIANATDSIYIATAPGSYTFQVTDTAGCTGFSNPIIISGIKIDYLEDAIKVLPNPTNTGWQLIVSTGWTGSKIELLDETGSIVFNAVISNLHSAIEIPGLANGVYVLRIISTNYNVTRKLVKE